MTYADQPNGVDRIERVLERVAVNHFLRQGDNCNAPPSN